MKQQQSRKLKKLEESAQALQHESCYHPVLFLAELTLSRSKDAKLSLDLVSFYAKELEHLLLVCNETDKKTVVERNNRLLRSIVTGIRRCLPYLPPDSSDLSVFQEMVEVMFRICHGLVASKSTLISMMILLHEILKTTYERDERERILKEKLRSSGCLSVENWF